MLAKRMIVVLFSVLVIACGEDAESYLKSLTPEQKSSQQTSSNERLQATLLKQEWQGIAAGSPLSTDDETRVMQIDLVCFNAVFIIQNLSSEKIKLHPSFSIAGSNDVELGTLKFVDSDNPKDRKILYSDIVLAPNEVKKINLISICDHLEDYQKVKPIYIEHKNYNWRWKTLDIPPRDILFKESIESGCYYSLRAKILEQKWKEWPAGTRALAGDTEVIVSDDVAGIEVTLEVTNLSSAELKIIPPLYLTGKDDIPFAPLLLYVEKAPPEKLPKTGIKISSRQNKKINFQSKFKGVEEVKNVEPLYIRHPQYEWKLPIIPLRPLSDDKQNSEPKNTDAHRYKEIIDGFRVQLYAANSKEHVLKEKTLAEQTFIDDKVNFYIEHENSMFKLRIGDCKTQREAIELRQIAQKRGYTSAWIVKTKVLVKPPSNVK